MTVRRAALRRAAAAGPPELNFNTEVGALRAIERVLLDAVESPPHWKYVPAVARKARTFLLENRLARRRNSQPTKIGGPRRIPGPVWAGVSKLSKLSDAPNREAKEEVTGAEFAMMRYAGAIQRADDSWRVWEDQRRKIRAVPKPEDPTKWRYPLSRAVFVTLQSTLLKAGYFQSVLMDLDRCSGEDCRLQPPKPEAEDGVWYAALAERWQRIVNDPRVVGRDMSLNDEYHTAWQEVARSIVHLRAAVASAGSELDGDEPAVMSRYTTRLSAAIDALNDALPGLARHGYQLPKEPVAMSRAIGEAVEKLCVFELELRAVALQPKPDGEATGTNGRRGGTTRRAKPSAEEVARDLRELERSVPPLDKKNGQWCSAAEAAKIDRVHMDSLKRQRQWGIPGEFLGKDEVGRIWRRAGTPRSHPWYLKESLKKFKA